MKDLSRTTAAILVGGLGTRLRSVIGDRPKVMAEACGRPFLTHLLDRLAAVKIRNVVLCTGYLGEQVRTRLGDTYGPLRLSYSQEAEPLGTGGSLRLAFPLLESNPVLVMNGDSFCQTDLMALWNWHRAKRSSATLVLTQQADSKRFGRVTVDEDGLVLRFSEKGDQSGPCWINGGIYLVNRPLLETIPEGKTVSLEHEVFPSWIGRGLYGYLSEGRFLDIGIPEAYAAAERFFMEDLRGTAGMTSEMKPGVDQRFMDVRAHLFESADLKRQIAENGAGSIIAAALLIAKALKLGGKLLLCGNGGSAADCQHLATEFVSRLTKDFDRPGLPAIALTTDTSFLTAFSNDCGFEGAFERQVQTLGQPGDVLIGISTSGNSANVVRAMEAAVKMGMTTVALTGSGGHLADIAQMTISVPNTNTLYIQEAHLAIEHILCSLVERHLFGRRNGEAEPTGTEQITRFDVRGETL